MILLNTDPEEPFEIAHGDRVAQLLIIQAPAHRLLQTDKELGVTARGEGGFGSTGR